MTEPREDQSEPTAEGDAPHTGMSRRKILGGLAAGAGAAAAASFAAGCSKEGGGGGLAGGGGDGPPGYGTGINEGFNGKIELDVRDSTPDWKPFELKKAPEGAPTSWSCFTTTPAWPPGRRTAGGSRCR